MSNRAEIADVRGLYAAAEPNFPRWEVLKDLVDEMIDWSLDYRQSGTPEARARRWCISCRL